MVIDNSDTCVSSEISREMRSTFFSFLTIKNTKLNAPKIEQVYFDIPEKAKPEALARLIDLHDIKLALVFCNTKNQVDNLVEILKSRGYFADGLHGDLSQAQREKVMNSFRSGSTEILVATDVAGRGADRSYQT